MTTKLTLTLEKEIIERAKRYAQSTGRSLSDLIENYLDTISNPKKPAQDKMPKKLQKLYGAVKLPSNLNHKTEIRKILSELKG
jgi:DNA anti-recombination protein RmuC